jgi:hypothetical protein
LGKRAARVNTAPGFDATHRDCDLSGEGPTISALCDNEADELYELHRILEKASKCADESVDGQGGGARDVCSI